MVVKTAQSAVFFMPEDDKNRKNVVINADDDKNAENVTDIQTDSTNNTVQEVHTHTHIQQATGYGPIEGPPPAACQNSIPAVADTQNLETENQTDSEQAANSDDISMLADQALSLAKNKSEKKDTALFDYLNDFFVKNCYGYKPKQSAKAIQQLAEEILKISDDLNPPVDIAAVLCGEYKKMTEGARSDYWKGQPLLPAYMIKSRCWMELMQYAGKILATKSNENKFVQAIKNAQEQVQSERAEIDEWQKAEYEKYGIDPASPDATMQLIRAKSIEKQNNEEPEEREMPEDIF